MLTILLLVLILPCLIGATFFAVCHSAAARPGPAWASAAGSVGCLALAVVLGLAIAGHL